MSRFRLHLHPKCFNFIVLILHLSLVSLSDSCLPDYAPDALMEDQIEYEWEHSQEGKRNFHSKCFCGGDHTGTTTHNPWSALIRVQLHDRFKFCSGTLINSHFILTAYSCMIKENPNAYDIWGPSSVRLETKNITVWLNVGDEVATLGNTEGITISDIIYNQKFIALYVMKRTKENNVVLLQLETPIDFAKQDSPIPVCLHPVIDIKSGVQSMVTGWTKGSKNGSIKTTKKYLKQSRILSLMFEGKDCNNSNRVSIPEGSLCTTSKDLISREGYEGRALCVMSQAKKVLLQVASTSWIDDDTKSAQSDSFIHYTGIKKILPFIYYHSAKVQATWCNEPIKSDFDNLKMVEVTKSSRPWVGFTSQRTGIPGCICGIHDAATGRIAGGDAAVPHEFKWQALLKIKVMINGKKQGTICGGSIINDRFILTAAHCVVQNEKLEQGDYPGVAPSDIRAYIGAHYKSRDPEARKVTIKRVWYHPGYVASQSSKEPYFDYDVALLELETALIFTPEALIPVCLPTSDKELDLIGKTALVTGWGLTDPGDSDSLSDILKKLEVPIQENSFCSSIMISRVTDRFICAGTLNRLEDAGMGDSGGPLSIIGEYEDQYVQVGIVSYGEDIENSRTSTAALYTNVQKVLDVIDYYSHMSGANWCLTE